MTEDIDQLRTELLNVMAEAGRLALKFDPLSAAAFAPIPSTDPQQYVVAGTLPMIAKVLPAESSTDWRPYHSALSRCAELLDNMKDGDPITEVPDFLAAYLASQSQAAQPSKHTDLANQLRDIAKNYGTGEYLQVRPQMLNAAAEEIERYYGGMLAWKQTAEKKDRDWNAERMGRVNDRISAGQSQATRAVPDGDIEYHINLLDGTVTVTGTQQPDEWSESPSMREALQAMEMALIGYTHQNDVTRAALAKCRAALGQAAPTAQEVTKQAVPEGWREVIQGMRDASYTITQYPETADVVFDSVMDALADLEADAKDAAQEVTQQAAKAETAEQARELVEQLRNHHAREIWDWDLLLNAATMIESLAPTASTVSAPEEVRHYDETMVREAWACVRKNNHNIPDDALDDMRDVLLSALRTTSGKGETA